MYIYNQMTSFPYCLPFTGFPANLKVTIKDLKNLCKLSTSCLFNTIMFFDDKEKGIHKK